MSLVNIAYGSTASSQTMNNNFSYLDNKIDSTSESIMTSISSILSNIATINSRISDLADTVSDSLDSMSSVIEDYRTKTKLLVKQATILPDWTALTSIDLKSENYTAPSNGYILVSSDEEVLTLSINGVSVGIKNSEEKLPLINIPVKTGDLILANANIKNSYFLPSAVVSINNF